MGTIKRIVAVGSVLCLFLMLSVLVFAQDPSLQIADDPNLGRILVGRDGKTVYTYANDLPNVSMCGGSCDELWPSVLIAPGVAPVGPEGLPGTLGTIERATGGTQVTLNGMPLYYFRDDLVAGDTKGHAANGLWFAVQVDALSAATPAAGVTEVATATEVATETATLEATVGPTVAATEAASETPTSAVEEVAATPEATVAAATTDDTSLPTTGAAGSWPLVLLLIGGLLILGGAGLTLAVQRVRDR